VKTCMRTDAVNAGKPQSHQSVSHLAKGETRAHACRTGGPGPRTGLGRAGQKCGGDRRARAGADAPADRPWPPPSNAPMVRGAHRLKQRRQWPSIPLAASPETAPPLVRIQPAIASQRRALRSGPPLLPEAHGTPAAGRIQHAGVLPQRHVEGRENQSKTLQNEVQSATHAANSDARRRPGRPAQARIPQTCDTHNGATGSRTHSRASLCGSAFPAGARAPAEPASPGPSNAKSGAPQVRGNGVK